MVGKTLGHYKILEPLGKGGMGEVYLGVDTRLGGVGYCFSPTQLSGAPTTPASSILARRSSEPSISM